MKNFNQAPLPFQGQKRRFQKEFKYALKSQFSDCMLFVDLFGGNGLLSQWAKETYPDVQVIYNDFDKYHLRIANIERTNALLGIIRDLVKDEPSDKVISKAIKESILGVIKDEENTFGYVDYITLSSSLLFSISMYTDIMLYKRV